MNHNQLEWREYLQLEQKNAEISKKRTLIFMLLRNAFIGLCTVVSSTCICANLLEHHYSAEKWYSRKSALSNRLNVLLTAMIAGYDFSSADIELVTRFSDREKRLFSKSVFTSSFFVTELQSHFAATQIKFISTRNQRRVTYDLSYRYTPCCAQVSKDDACQEIHHVVQSLLKYFFHYDPVSKSSQSAYFAFSKLNISLTQESQNSKESLCFSFLARCLL